MQSYRGGAVIWRLPRTLVARIDAASREMGGTPFIVLMAAFQALLCRYTDQAEINVGTPIAGRTRTEIEGLIGFFVNTLVLRASLAGNPGFGELVGACATSRSRGTPTRTCRSRSWWRRWTRSAASATRRSSR